MRRRSQALAQATLCWAKWMSDLLWQPTVTAAWVDSLPYYLREYDDAAQNSYTRHCLCTPLHESERGGED